MGQKKRKKLDITVTVKQLSDERPTAGNSEGSGGSSDGAGCGGGGCGSNSNRSK